MVKFYFLLLLIAITDVHCGLKFETKIIGGKPVSIDKYPSSVQFINIGSLCAGSILNSWSVLTSAHCFDHNSDPMNMLVHAGASFSFSNDGVIYDVSSFIIHEDYNKSQIFACDIGIIFVSSPIQFNKKVKKAILVHTDMWMNQKEDSFVATGWGYTQYEGPVSQLGLLKTHLRFVPQKNCNRMHNVTMSPDMFCLYGDAKTDTCKGDSGGGVLWKGFLVGIVSHGEKCALKNKPSVYANVWYFRSWIKKHIDHYVDTFCNDTAEHLL